MASLGEECVIYKIETFDSDSRKRQQERIVGFIGNHGP